MRPATRIERASARPATSASRRPSRTSSPIRRADSREGIVLATERDELRRASEQLDELGRQLAPGVRLPTAGDPREARGENWHGAARKREPEREHDRRGRKEECGRDDAGDRDDESHEDGSDAAQVEPLERVDVADHPADEVTAAKRLELRGRERLDPPVERRADPPESPQREVVGREALEVARERTGEREEADDDDDRRQREDRRLLGRACDEVAGRRHERDAEADGRRAERDRENDAPKWELGERE